MRARDGIPTNQFHRLEQSLSGDAPYGQDRCVTTRKTALVTGAGAGAGREYVRLLLLEGSTVLAVSLLDDELGDLQAELDPGNGRLVIKRADLSEPNAAEKLLAWCDASGYQVDTLINNAGFATYGDPTSADLDKIERMLNLNVLTSTKLSVLFGRRMKERRSGRILIMGSSAGYSPTIRLGAYGASKAYTNAFAFCLGAELRTFGITVTCVTPGTFKSKFASTAGLTTHNGEGLLQKMYAEEKLEASAVARAGYEAMRAGKATVTVGRNGHLAKVLGRVLSPVFIARMSRRI
jgi:uncharacterized protein